MGRRNNKELKINRDSSIQKSNELSMSKLNQGLTLNQMQLLAYAIFSTQQDGKTEFRKHEFQEKFGIEKYQTVHAREDAKKLMNVQFSIEDLEHDYFEFWNVFVSIKYKSGLFNFKWNEEFIPHILELKEKYVTTDLTVTSNFKSGFSWILYDYLKAHYGYWHKQMTKKALMNLFAVERRKSYIKSTAQFKRGVLDVAIAEINNYTELNVWYTENKIGNKIVGFKIHWSTGKKETGITNKQISLLKAIYQEVDNNIYKYLNLYDINSNIGDRARENIIKIKDMDKKVNKELSLKEADKFIVDMKMLYEELQSLLEKSGEERDTSFYYDWTKED